MAILAIRCFETSKAFVPRTFVAKRPFLGLKRAVETRNEEDISVSAVDARNDKEMSTSEELFDFSDPLSPIIFGEKLVIPFTQVSVEYEGGVNNGLWSWMFPYMNIIGYKKGNTVVGGVPTKDKSTSFSEAEKELLRTKAKEELVNISDDERIRRGELASTFFLVSVIYGMLASIILDDGSFAGHLIRFAILVPLSLSYGLHLSNKEGV